MKNIFFRLSSLLRFVLFLNNLEFILLGINKEKGKPMQSTAKGLRFHTKELLESVSRGEEVTITFRGKPYAKLVPLKETKKNIDKSNELFGIWKNRTDMEEVNAYVRGIRKERFL